LISSDSDNFVTQPALNIAGWKDVSRFFLSKIQGRSGFVDVTRASWPES